MKNKLNYSIIIFSLLLAIGGMGFLYQKNSPQVCVKKFNHFFYCSQKEGFLLEKNILPSGVYKRIVVQSKKTREKRRQSMLGKNKGEKNGRYIDGRTARKAYCMDCGKELLCNRSKRCHVCVMKKRYKNPLEREKQSKRQRGENNPWWKGGITPLRLAIHNLSESKQWREAVFLRDNYTCQKCGVRSGDGKTVYLEAHHCKKRYGIIIDEFLKKYNQFSPIKDKEILIKLAINYKPFWNITNGQTLCRGCHKLTKLGAPKKDNI